MLNTIYNRVESFEKINTNKKKSEGVVYTPKYICDFIISELNPTLEETILEPSVGHGVFIFSLLDYIKEKYKLTPNEVLEYLNNKVYSFELSKQSCIEFQKLIDDYFKSLGVYGAVYQNIYNKDTLFSLNIKEFDIGLGNPPYIRIKNLDTGYANNIRDNFKSCEAGNIDIYYAFIELAIKKCKKVGMITPNSYLTNVSAQKLRSLMLDRVIKVIDFKDKMIFKNASTYTSIFILGDKKTSSIYYSNNIDSKYIKKSKTTLEKKSWFFKEYENTTEQIKIEDSFNLSGGIGTLKDKVYIVNEDKVSNIEDDVLVDFYKITKRKKGKIIFPYNDKFKIIQEALLKEQYPNCYSHLLNNKNDLLARDKGKIQKYEAWYAYGRKQGFPKKIYKYNLMIPIMFSKETKTFLVESNNIILFSSGYMLSSNNIDDINKIKELMESEDFFRYISIYGKIWKGKPSNPYYTFGINILREYLNIKTKSMI